MSEVDVYDFQKGGVNLNVTAGLLYGQLKKLCPCQTNLVCEVDFDLQGFQVWDGQKPEKGVVYLCKENVPDGKMWRQVLVVGLEGTFKAERNSPWIVLTEIERFYQLINLVQQAFQCCYDQYLHMDQVIHAQHDWDDILNELEKTWDVLAVLVDTNLKYLAISKEYRTYNPWLQENNTLPMEIAEILMKDEAFWDAVNCENAFVYAGDEGNLISYCYNIRIAGEYTARFMVQSRDGKPFYGGMKLVQMMGEKLESVFIQYNKAQKQEQTEAAFYEMIRALVLGLPKDSKTLEQTLAVRSWKPHDLYQVYLLEIAQGEDVNVIWRYYQKRLEELLGECCLVILEKHLCCVRNLSSVPQDEWDIHQNLAVFLRENLYKAGISQTTQTIEGIHTSYLQAVSALELGLESGSTNWYYKFDDQILEYVCRQSTTEMDAANLYHPAILTLMEYDQKESASLTQTVFAYMQNCYNVTRTAEALFIHRTTLLFRLQRIEILTGLKWDSWKDRVHLALTFELLHVCSRQTV